MGRTLTPLSIVVPTVALLTTASAQAGGFRLPDVSATGVALANALVANPVEDGAIPLNPVAMSFQPGEGVIGGSAMIIDFGTEVTRTGATAESDSNTPVAIPSFYIAQKIDDTWAVGLNLNTPFGLATRWDSGTFSNLGGSDPTLSRIRMVNLNPNVAAKFGNTAISIGPAYYRIEEVVQDTTANHMIGSGDNTGYHIGLMHVEDNWSIGASYRSQITVPVTGSLNSVLPISVDFPFPELLQVGARVEITDDLAIEYDIERVGWSAYDEINIIRTDTGATLQSSKNGWQDTTVHRLGATYRVNDNVDLMFGYLNDQNPQPENHFAPRLPALDYDAYSIGIGYRMGSIRLVGSYQYLDFKDRTINSTTAYNPLADANGTTVYNGDYSNFTHQIGLGISASF